MPISKQNNCLFIHIPKTAGTSIEKALGMFSSWKIENVEKLFGLIQSKELKTHNFLSQFLQHLTINNIHQLKINTKNLFSFSFVRNPWEKMVSIYSNTDPHLLQQAKNQGIHLKGLVFEDFIHNIFKIKHIHLLPQNKFIFNENNEVLVDFIGRFETLELDFQKLCLILNVSCKLSRHNESKHLEYQSYYTDETREIIAKIYEDDIRIFNYNF